VTLAESIKANSEEREIRYALGELAVEEGRPADAKEMLRLLQTERKCSQNLDAELECLILQTRLELIGQQNDAALNAALQAQSISGTDDRFDLKMAAAQVLAKAAAALRKWTQADEALGSAMLRASQSGCVACELRAKLSECELKAQKNSSDASLCFVNLHRTAVSKGFGWIAKNAATRSHRPTS
jgi:hypothetical protein